MSPALILVGNWSLGQLWLPASLGSNPPTLGFFAGLFLGPGLLADAAVKAFRKDWMAAGAAGFAAVGAFVGLLVLGSAVRAGMRLRVAGYARLAAEITPVVAAVDEFERAKGRLPSSLAELSPAFLPQLARAVDRVQYVREGERPNRQLYRNKWMFWSDAAWGMGFDSFVYFPNRPYPTYMFGGSPERVGEWAYIHE